MHRHTAGDRVHRGHGLHNQVHPCSGIDKDTSVTPGPHHNYHNYHHHHHESTKRLTNSSVVDQQFVSSC